MPFITPRSLLLCLIALLAFAPLLPAAPAQRDAEEIFAQVPRLRPEIISTRPHDPGAFTQGLELHGNILYESTGQYGKSTLRETNPRTGQVIRAARLPDNAFGEGITVVADSVLMLTWRRQACIVFDRTSLQPRGQLGYSGEGWGLAYDGTHLVMSNGTDQLVFREVESFDVVTSVTVNLLGDPVGHINELEYVDGFIWANVWLTDLILKIDPATGGIVSVVNCEGLLTPEERAQADVLNGIAYDKATKTFLITGKKWPKTFEVVFVSDE
ncbi:MAG: glutaminyl-peptide cyclotransferase [Candidatus Sumerlaeota bacterium]|nr:glutaminyl-peptide cyclotransferase [Candidatus Sumerlaeota bacterium]